MGYKFLNKYILESEKEEIDTKVKHHLFPIKEDEITKINKIIPIPLELYNFYLKVGYGFFFTNLENSDRLLGPNSFKKINLREDYYEYDPDLELYDYYSDKLIFFEVNEGVYLLIDKEDKNGKNAIYYINEKIADSLEEFLIRFDEEGHYFEEEN